MSSCSAEMSGGGNGGGHQSGPIPCAPWTTKWTRQEGGLPADLCRWAWGKPSTTPPTSCDFPWKQDDTKIQSTQQAHTSRSQYHGPDTSNRNAVSLTTPVCNLSISKAVTAQFRLKFQTRVLGTATVNTLLILQNLSLRPHCPLGKPHRGPRFHIY